MIAFPAATGQAIGLFFNWLVAAVTGITTAAKTVATGTASTLGFVVAGSVLGIFLLAYLIQRVRHSETYQLLKEAARDKKRGVCRILKLPPLNEEEAGGEKKKVEE